MKLPVALSLLCSRSCKSHLAVAKEVCDVQIPVSPLSRPLDPRGLKQSQYITAWCAGSSSWS
eukprot:1833571-Pleurochrysis_carterae.AAC.1